MSPTNILKITNYLPFWDYYQRNKCIPPINMPTLEAIAAIYREELHPAPVRLYCSVCVEEMITTLFYQYEREMQQAELAESDVPANEVQTQLAKTIGLDYGNLTKSPRIKKGRKVKRKNTKPRK